MKAQLDFLRKNSRATIEVDSSSRFPKVRLNYTSWMLTTQRLLLFLVLFCSSQFTYGQVSVTATIASPNTNAVDICAGIPLQIEAMTMPSDVPLIWKSKNNNGTFSDSLNHTTAYTPKAVTGTSRLDEIIVTLDQGYATKWQNLIGIDTMGGQFKCTIAGLGKSGAQSVNTLLANTDGWVETKLTTAVQATFGLSATNNNLGIVDFGIQISKSQNKAFVIENNIDSPDATPISLVAGDNIFRVERVGNTILYKHNRTVFHTSTIVSSSALFVDVSMANIGETLDMTVSFGDNTYVFPADTIKVQVLKAVNLDIGLDKEICEGDSTTVSLTISGATFDQWKTVNGAFNATTRTFTPTSPLNVLTRIDSVIAFTFPASNSVCPAVSDTALITVRKAPAIAMVADNALCERDSISLTTTPSQNADTVFWSGSNGTFTTISGQPNDIKYAPSETLTTATRKDLVYVATNSIYPVCPTAKDTTEITVHWQDEVENAFSTASICEGDAIEMKAILSRAATQINWTKATTAIGGFQNPMDTNTIYTPTGIIDSIRYDTLFVTTIPVGVLNCNAAIDTVIIAVLEVDKVQNTFSQATICEGDSIKMDATLSGAATKIKWATLQSTGAFINPDSTDAIYVPNLISDTLPTNRIDTLMAVTVPLTSCEPDTIYVWIDVRNAPQLAAVADVTICDLEEVVLETTKLGPGELKIWSAIPALNSTFTDYQNDSLKVTYTPTNLATNATTARIDTVFFLTHDTSAVCPAYQDSLFVTINPRHQVSIDPNYGANPTDLDTISVCEGTSTDSLLAIIGGSTTTVNWSVISNAGSFDNATALKPIYTPNLGLTTNSRYDTLIITSTNNVTDCPAVSDSLILHVQRAAAVTIAPDTTVCETGTVQLTASSTGFGDTLFWQVLNGLGQFNNTKIKDTTTTVANTVIYQPTGDVTAQFRVDTILYATVNPLGVCPAVEDTIFISVYNSPTVEVDDPTKMTDTLYVCEGIGLALDGSYGGGAIGATWSVLGNAGEFSGITNDTIATYIPNAITNNQHRVDTVLLTANTISGACNTTIIQDTLYVLVQTGPIITATEDSLTLCEDNSILLKGTFGSVATGFTWSTKVAGSGDIAILTDTTATYTPTGTITSPGRLDVIYLTSTNGNATCLTATDSIEIFVSAKPILALGADVSMCGNLTQLLTPTQIGVGNQITWTSTNGTFANNPSPTGLYQPTFPIPTLARIDGIIVNSIDSLELCSAVKDTMLVTVYGLARVAIGEVGSVCEDDSLILNPAYGGTLADFSYTISNDAGEVMVGNNQLLYHPSENTTLNNRIDTLIINLGDIDNTGLCPTLMDTIEITVLNTPRASLIGDTTICLGDQVNLLTESFGIVDIFQSSLSSSLINYPSTPPTIVNGIIQDTITYQTKLIDGACPVASQQIIVTIGTSEEIGLNLLDTTICEANTLLLNAGLTNPNNYSYKWQLLNQTGSLDNDTIASPTYTPNMDLTTTTRMDTVLLEVINQTNTCSVGKDTLIITVMPSATLGDLRDTTICEGDTLDLSITLDGAANFFWSSVGGSFADSSQLQTTFSHASFTDNSSTHRVSANLTFDNNTCATIQKTINVTILGQSTVFAGIDSTICTGFDFQLDGSFGFGIDSAEWSVIDNNGSFDTIQNLNAIYTPNPLNGIIERTDALVLSTTTTFSCITPVDTLFLTIKPTPSVNLGPDYSVVGLSNQILAPSLSESISTARWKAQNGDFINTTPTNTTYVPNPLNNDTLRLDTIIYQGFTPLENCRTIVDTLIISFAADTAVITDTLINISRDINSDFCQSYCIDTTNLIIDANTGTAIVLANNIDPLDTCTLNSAIDFRFWHPALGTPEPIHSIDFPELPGTITYDCDDRGLQNVNVYVATDSSTIQLCPAVINVEDEALACGERTIAGRITTFKGNPVKDFEVFLQGTSVIGGVVPPPVLTDEDGRYEITVDANTSYRIRPMNNQDITEGVTAFDNVIISRHILGLQPFESPYQTIAADVNKSGTITAFDIVLIRKVVLARENSFENNTSWRFIDANFQFTDIMTAAAAPFMESFEVTSDMGNVTDMDFIAVKIGDVNDTSSGLVSSTEARSDATPIIFEVVNQPVEKGKIYEVPFQLSKKEKVAAYQFTLNFEGLALLDIQSGIATPAHFETKLAERGLLTTCWSTPTPMSSNDTWFTLQFKATKNGRLSELLTVNSEITPIEAYTSKAENIGVQLSFNEPITTTFDLFQNKPNPFKNQTIIGFALPQAAPAKITVMDMQGKIIYSTADNYESGYNEVIIQQSQLPKGVFYYRLETAFGTKTQKMMHLE